ncbi:MAG: hypothetical protein IPI49_28460 [Myxococcales bacterium]|nr:hypothetical protein [Myxococcales bacterium]
MDVLKVTAPRLWFACLAALAVGGACGGPVLQNAPRPNPTVVAGAVAATAAAITLADPDAAARHASEVEKSGRAEREPASSGSRETAPVEVLDRLDEAQAHPAQLAAPSGKPVREIVWIPWLPAPRSPER